MNNKCAKSRLLGLLIVLGIFLLQGCESVAPRSSFPSEGILLDHANLKAKDDAAWFDAANLNREALMLQYDGKLSPSLAFYLERDLHIHDDRELSAYLSKIIDRLLDGWEGIKPDISVVIESDEFFNAFINKYNQNNRYFRLKVNNIDIITLF